MIGYVGSCIKVGVMIWLKESECSLNDPYLWLGKVVALHVIEIKLL